MLTAVSASSHLATMPGDGFNKSSDIAMTAGGLAAVPGLSGLEVGGCLALVAVLGLGGSAPLAAAAACTLAGLLRAAGGMTSWYGESFPPAGEAAKSRFLGVASAGR